jgi:hypothetical protein
MEMERRTVHRGILALAVVTSLSAAGSRPAAAVDLGLRDRFDRLLSFVTGIPAQRVASRPHRATEKAPVVPGTKKGWGIDPNGVIPIDPDVPTQDATPGSS